MYTVKHIDGIDGFDMKNPRRLFSPDEVMRHQFFKLYQQKSRGWMEELMLAVLEDAFACIQKQVRAVSGRNKHLFDEDMQWVRERESDWLFSFENVCEILGFSASRLRDGIERWVDGHEGIAAKSVKRQIRVTPCHRAISSSKQ